MRLVRPFGLRQRARDEARREALEIVAVITPAVVPHRQMLAAANDGEAMTRQAGAQAKHVAPGTDTELATRREDRLGDDDDAAVLLQREAEGNLFGCEQAFVESARAIERASRAEHKTAGSETA